ncbi:MAG: DUF3768 domain-containing protein [Candidatus Woesebacteria bacterium]|jgi:hypothetical protein
MNKDASKIAILNDTFRKTSHKIMVTRGVKDLEDLPELISEIRRFNDFTKGNDPCGEHDFGSLEWHGKKVFWKIDCYDRSLMYRKDPLSSDCRRVLTVMLASKY